MPVPCKKAGAWRTGRAWEGLAGKTCAHTLQHIPVLWAWLMQQPVIDREGGGRSFNGAALTQRSLSWLGADAPTALVLVAIPGVSCYTL